MTYVNTDLKAKYQEMVDKHMTVHAMAKVVGKRPEAVRRYLSHHSIVPRPAAPKPNTRPFYVTELSDHSSSRHAQTVVTLPKEPWL